MWTVEWIREDKSRTLTESSGALCLLQAQPFKPFEESRKKRRAAEQLTKLEAQTKQGASTPTLANNENPASRRGDESLTISLPAQSQQDDPGPDKASTHPDIVEPKPATQKRYNFYLLKPRTSSTRQILIPLDENATLADCIRGCTVLEFPTIYAFPVSQSPPSEEFMLEHEYLIEESNQQKEFESMVKGMSPEALHALKGSSDENEKSEQIDSNAILDVLKQDLGAGG